MTDKLTAERLRALDEAASNARPDGDGDFSSYIKAEGALSRYLKECIPAILAMAEERDRMREALDWAMAFLLEPTDAHTRDYQEGYAAALRALGKDQA